MDTETTENTTTFYQPEKTTYMQRFIRWAKKNPFQATLVCGLGLGIVEYRVHKHLVYSATLKANKKTIDYIASVLDSYIGEIQTVAK